MSLAFVQAIFGDKELALGCTYGQLSRATALSGIVLRDTMTLTRLLGLCCAFDLTCDAGAIATLQAARAARPADAAALAAELDTAIAEAETGLTRAQAALKCHLDTKAAVAAAQKPHARVVNAQAPAEPAAQ